MTENTTADDGSGTEILREPGDGESYDGAGHIRPVPADVPPTPEVDDVS